MKILTGRLRGHAIRFHANPRLRPTSDRARKAIFDMLQGGLEGKRVLDLFSGTGAIGFEALSSDAAEVIFVEIDKSQTKRISEDIHRLGLDEKTRVICQDVLRAIRHLAKKDEKFDIVFLDPPYGESLGFETLDYLAVSALLSERAFVVFECRDKEETPRIEGLRMMKSRDYGDAKIILYQKEKK